MGCWLNSGNERFRQRVKNNCFYVDKTGMLVHLNGWIDSDQRYVCVSRARRFGKTIAADMIAAYYDKTVDSRKLFEAFEIAKDSSFEKGLNKFNVLYFDAQSFMEISRPEAFLPQMNNCLLRELSECWPWCGEAEMQTLQGVLSYIYNKTGERFVIVIDEWDCIFRHHFPERIQREYVDFLRQLFKSGNTNQFCVLAYLTGIFPIVKYNTESAMNLFFEYTMIDSKRLSPYVGFTEDEVKGLCKRFDIDFEACKRWYDGYALRHLEHIYNPNSVYKCMSSGDLGSYWTKTGTYEQISDHISMNFDGLKDNVSDLLEGKHIPVDTSSFNNKMDEINNRDDVLTLLIHLGYLAYDIENEECYIPNHEIYLEFILATRACGWTGFYESFQSSKRLMRALVSKDAVTVAAEIQRVHDELSSVLTYNREADLALVVMYACAAGRKDYIMVRELPAGTGFADIVMIPVTPAKPAVVLELKQDGSAEGAIEQIKKHRYPNVFGNYKGKVLLCGVNYNRNPEDTEPKRHSCVIEDWEI